MTFKLEERGRNGRSKAGPPILWCNLVDVALARKD